jgi:hypothetical protein
VDASLNPEEYVALVSMRADDRFRIGLLSSPTGNLAKNVRDDLRELGDSF